MLIDRRRSIYLKEDLQRVIKMEVVMACHLLRRRLPMTMMMSNHLYYLNVDVYANVNGYEHDYVCRCYEQTAVMNGSMEMMVTVRLMTVTNYQRVESYCDNEDQVEEQLSLDRNHQVLVEQDRSQTATVKEIVERQLYSLNSSDVSLTDPNDVMLHCRVVADQTVMENLKVVLLH